MNPLKGELEYGSISLDDKEDYRLYRYSDAGMGETEYRIFRNGAFFAMFDNRKDAEEVMTVMTHKSERDKIICCARCPCKEPDCEDFCKHFQPTGDLIAVIKDGDLIESREALEHHFGRHDTCKSERTRCPLCREELRRAGEP